MGKVLQFGETALKRVYYCIIIIFWFTSRCDIYRQYDVHDSDSDKSVQRSQMTY